MIISLRPRVVSQHSRRKDRCRAGTRGRFTAQPSKGPVQSAYQGSFSSTAGKTIQRVAFVCSRLNSVGERSRDSLSGASSQP
jgi:hypothetical protein